MSASSSKGIQLCFSGPSGGLPSLPSLPSGSGGSTAAPTCVQTPAPPSSPLPVSAQGGGSLAVAGSGGSMSASSSKGIQLCFSGPSGGLPSLP